MYQFTTRRLLLTEDPAKPALTFSMTADGVSVGSCAMKFCEKTQSAALTIELLPEAQKKGYAAEAMEALLAFAFDTLQLHRVTASCSGENYAAQRVLAALGLRREGFLVQAVPTDGGWDDLACYAMLDTEYKYHKDPTPPMDPITARRFG